MEEYIKLLLEQIRCKKAHPYIREEIQGHMEEQIMDNLALGMSQEKAEQAAVKDMGSPIEAGIALDKIHKPQIAWDVIAIMALISITGIIIHYILNRQLGENAIGSSKFIFHTILGFVFMLIIYRVDYSTIARFSKIIGMALIGLGIYSLFNGGIILHGMTYYVHIGTYIPLFSLLMLYVPLYGGIIYKYHGLGYGALLKSILWMLVPVMIAFRLPSLPLAMILLVSMSVVLTVALAHDWFKVAKKKVIAALWICELGFPIGGLTLGYVFKLLADYQRARIQAFFSNSGDANYVTSLLRSLLSDCQFIGNSGRELVGTLPEYNNSFILSYMLSTYGLLIGILICCVFTALIITIFAISFNQKNQLGMCMGCGCGMIILLNVVINIGENLGIFPLTQTFLPFFSTGGSNIVVCYILMGIILSIYRYKNIYTKNVKLPVMKLTIGL